MSFFDKKQEVIDIKLTRFGRGLLARGNFKPTYYRFFDDDILYDSECANIVEDQNRSEERILEAQRLKTQYLSVGVETTFDDHQEKIRSGLATRFTEISENQNPLVAEKLLRYPLQNSKTNSQNAPRFLLSLHGVKSSGHSEKISVKGIDLSVPQISITSSYTLTRDIVNQKEERDIPQMLMNSENYIDLSREKINFLDDSFLEVEREDIIIDLEELGVDLGIDNFELEIFEVIEEDEEKRLIKIEDEEEMKKYFDISTDSLVTEITSRSLAGKIKPRGRN